MITVTLSVVCTLKGMCQHTLFDLGGVEIHEYKRSKQCQRFKVLNAMYAGDIGDGVCGIYANAYRHTVYCIHAPRPSKKGSSFKKSPYPVGLAVHHHAVRGGSFVNFLGLVKLQG